MINFSINLNWPWFKPIKGRFNQIDYIEKTWKITENKSLEVQLIKGGNTLIGTSFRWDTHCDHAGVILDISLFRYFFMINFYDNRHWNHEKNRYVNYNDSTEGSEYW